MKWKIAYYSGSLPLTYTSSSQQTYEQVANDNVISITISSASYSHTLQGFDYYWISGSEYGAFNATGSLAVQEEEARREAGYQEVVYEGVMKCRYRWNTQHESLGEQDAPTACKILNGIMIPDDDAREIGLL